MRIHTNKLSMMHVIHTLQDERAAERIAPDVGFKVLDKKGSRSHKLAFEIQLEAVRKVDGDGRRFGNSGSYGAGENYTATYDEWGFFLAGLYEKDPEMVGGSVKNPIYANDTDFHIRTGYSYYPQLAELIGNFGGDPYPFVTAKNGAGRRGAGRSDGENLPGYVYADALNAHLKGTKPQHWAKYEPRTVAWVKEFRKEA